MDARLHGHHHSSGFGSASHNHAAGANDTADHTKRFQVWITNNKIYANSRYGLAYLDTIHLANDRTAASEQNQELNKPHIHHTRVHVTTTSSSAAGSP